MRIYPVHTSIGRLFGDDYIFRVPKYQRNYAWTDTEIEDFISDLERCISAQTTENPRLHFFGGIVSVLHEPAQNRICDLVDGQQRMATFIMLVSIIISISESLLLDATENGQTNIVDLLNIRVESLISTYIVKRQEVNLEIESIDRIELSGPDKQFFKNLITRQPQTENIDDRESFRRMNNAYQKINEYISSKVEAATNLEEKLDILKIIEDILDESFTVIHMMTESKRDAYRLFQVLNDRGTGLTVGDLLRSRTLEMLENQEFQAQQDNIQSTWNDILADHPDATENFLQWYFSSMQGRRPPSSSLLDDFLDAYFPNHSNVRDGIATSNDEANRIMQTVSNILEEVRVCRKLVDGIWPFQNNRSVTQWHKDRLRLLIVELKHTNCMPLLLAAANNLDAPIFAEIVELIKRFVFRYKIICNQHISPITRIYHNHSTAIRRDPANYRVQSLVEDLHERQEESAPNHLFTSNLQELKYNTRRGNKPLKYLLMTLEHYGRWFRNGAIDSPECLDTTRVFDFTNTTIEHIYPQNPTTPIPELEPLVHNLGNLTFLGPNDNRTVGNMSFEDKRPILSASSISLNTEIGDSDEWNEEQIYDRQEQLIEMANIIFSV